MIKHKTSSSKDINPNLETSVPLQGSSDLSRRWLVSKLGLMSLEDDVLCFIILRMLYYFDGNIIKQILIHNAQ